MPDPFADIPVKTADPFGDIPVGSPRSSDPFADIPFTSGTVTTPSAPPIDHAAQAAENLAQGPYTPRVPLSMQAGAQPTRTATETLLEPLIPFHKLAVSAQTVQDAWDVLKSMNTGGMMENRRNEPIPTMQQQLEGPPTPPSTGAKVVAGAQSAALTVPESMTSPLGIATLGAGAAGAVAGRVVSGAFAADMLRQTPEKVVDVYEAFKLDLGPEEAAKRIGELTLNTAMLAATAKHTATDASPGAEAGRMLAKNVEATDFVKPGDLLPQPKVLEIAAVKAEAAGAPATAEAVRAQAETIPPLAELDAAYKLKDELRAVMAAQPGPISVARVKDRASELPLGLQSEVLADVAHYEASRPDDTKPAVPETNPVRENGARTSLVLPDGTAIVGGRFHGETFQTAIEQGLASNEDLLKATAAFTRPDGTSWNLQGTAVPVKKVVNLQEASAGVKALAVGEVKVPEPTMRSTPPPGSPEKDAPETATISPPAGETKAPVAETAADFAPIEHVKAFEELRNITIDFNAKRTTKARKSELIARASELRKELARAGYDSQQIKDVEMGNRGVPMPEPISPPAAPASSPPVADVTAPSATRTPEAAAVDTPDTFQSAGPGAAAKGEPGSYDPAAQLSDALKTVKETDPLKRAQESNRIADVWQAGKDATTRAWGRVIAAKESIKDNLLTLPEGTPLKRLVAALDFQIQKSSAFSRGLGKTFEETHPNRTRRNGIAIFVDAGLDAEKVRAAIAALPDKTPLRIRRAFEAAADLTEAELDTAGRIKTYFEQRLQDAQQAGVLKGFLEDYYTHVWKRPERMPEELKNAMSNGRVVSYFENARERKLDDFITGVKLGFEPLLDPSLVLPKYNFNLDRAIASRAFIKQLTDTTEADGRATAAPTGIGKQISTTEFVVSSDATGRTRRVFETREEADAAVREGESVSERENTASLISPKAKSEATADYKPVDNPALKKWKWATNAPDGTPILVEGDLVIHPDALQRVKNMMERERLTAGTAMRVLIRAGAEVKGAKLGVLSPFHQIHVGSHALFHLVNPFSLKSEIDWANPATRFAVEKGGLKLAADFHDKMAFSEGIGPGLIAQKVVPFARMYSEYLFESFIPRLKLKTFEAVYQRDLKRYAGKLSSEQIAARAGDAVNNAYGELNRLWLGENGRDPRLQRAMQVTMLAPDFLEARYRFVAKAFTKYGAEERMALYIMGGGLYVTARVLNQLTDGDPHWKEPNMAFSVRIGDKNYSIRSVIGDVTHLLTDWRSFASTRINPVTTRTAVEALTKRDIRTGLSKTTAEEAADMLRQIVPSQLDSMLPGDRQWWFGFMQSMGITARRQPTDSELLKRAQKDAKDKANPPAYEMIYNPKHQKKP